MLLLCYKTDLSNISLVSHNLHTTLAVKLEQVSMKTPAERKREEGSIKIMRN